MISSSTLLRMGSYLNFQCCKNPRASDSQPVSRDPFGGCLSDIYMMMHTSRKIRVLKLHQKKFFFVCGLAQHAGLH